MKIFLNAGHGGTDCGACSKNGTKEADITLKIVNLLTISISAFTKSIEYLVLLVFSCFLTSSFLVTTFATFSISSSKSFSSPPMHKFLSYKRKTLDNLKVFVV